MKSGGAGPLYRWTWVWLVVLTGLALCLRLIGLNGPSFKIWDDFFALRLGVLSPLDILYTLKHQSFDPYQEFQPPLYYVLMRVFFIFGHGDVLARIPGVLTGTLSVPVLYFFGRRHFGSPAAWIASGMLAVSLYHIEYSQQIRNYVTFLFFALCSMYCFSVWLEKRRVVILPWYALGMALLFYTSYMATAVAATQAAVLITDMAFGKKGSLFDRIKAQAPLVAAGGVAALAFSPWLPTYFDMYRTLRGITGGTRPPVLDTLVLTFRDYVSFYCDQLGYPEAFWPMAGLCVVGLGVALSGRDRRRLLLPTGWVLVTLVVVFGFNRNGLHVRTRHLIAVLPVVYLLSASGAWALASLAARLGNRPKVAPILVAILVLGLNAFNFCALPEFYRREDDRLKALCHEMGTYARGRERSLFWGSDSKWFPAVADFVLGWYLPGVFKDPKEARGREYLRAWMLCSSSQSGLLRGMDGIALHGRVNGVDLYDVGVVNVSPVVVSLGCGNASFNFREDFATPASLGRTHHLENMFLDKGRAGLVDRRCPGKLTYSLLLPEDSSCFRFSVRFSASFLADISGTPASVLRIEAASGQQDFVQVASFAFADLATRPDSGFDSRVLRVSQSVDLSPGLFRTGLCRVRFVLDPGPDNGMILLEKINFAISGQGPQAPPNLARLKIKNVLANTAVRPWRSGVYDDGALYAFRTGTEGIESDLVGDARALADFCRTHPGLPPVLRIGDRKEGYALYDLAWTGLPAPLAALAGDRGNVSPDGARAKPDPGRPETWPASSVAVEGQPAQLGDEPLPFVEGGKCWLNLDAGGAGTLVAKLFFSGEEEAAGVSTRSQGVRVAQDGLNLTCSGTEPCFVVYKFTAPQGFTDIRVVTYPRLYNDLGLGNFCRVSVSRNGRDYEPLDTLRSNASRVWDPLGVARGSGKKWALPSSEIYLKLILSGNGAQLWSTPERPLLAILALAPRQAREGREIPGGTGKGFAQMLRRPAGAFTSLLQSY